ncbi:MAG: ArnT family glycosyltransferase [Steroidobacteraceae bacterium]
MSGSRIALACCVILSPLWIATMFGRGLWTPDEPREADISWRMATQPDPAVPVLAGQPILEKPPLAYWIAGTVTSLAPKHDAALRLPNLVYACIATFAIVLLAYAMDGAIAAWIAGIASGSFLLALQVSAWLATDAAMMSGVTLALLGFYRGLRAPGGRAKLLWYLLMHAGLAWAFMAKGPAAWLVPVLAGAGLIVLERNWEELRRWELWTGAAVPLIVIGAWLLAVAQRAQGQHELSVMLWSNVAGRAFALPSDVAYDYSHSHRNWPAKYLVELPIYLLPWTFLFVAALRRATLAVRRADGMSWRFAACALILPLIVLSVAVTARGIYAAPLLPAAALLLGLWAAECGLHPDPFDRRMISSTFWAVAVVVILLLGATAFVVSADPAAIPSWPAAAAGAVISIVVLAIARQQRQRFAWFAMLGATFAAFSLAIVTTAMSAFPAIDRWQDLATLARTIHHDAGDRPLALYAPDETIVAVVDRTLAAQRPEVLRVQNIEDGRMLYTRAQTSVLLVLLPGTGDGPVVRRLRSLGINSGTRTDSPAVRELTEQLGLSVERIYELPQGRRYALLSCHLPATGNAGVCAPRTARAARPRALMLS